MVPREPDEAEVVLHPGDPHRLTVPQDGPEQTLLGRGAFDRASLPVHSAGDEPAHLAVGSEDDQAGPDGTGHLRGQVDDALHHHRRGDDGGEVEARPQQQLFAPAALSRHAPDGTTGCIPPALHAVEQLGLLHVELGLGDDAPLAQFVELVDLLGDRELAAAGGAGGVAGLGPLDL